MSDALCPMDCRSPGSSAMGFSRQEYWRGLPHTPPEDLPDPEIEPKSLTSRTLASGFSTTTATWEAQFDCKIHPLKQRLFDPVVLRIKSLSFHTQFIHLFKKNYLSIWLQWVLVVACKLLAVGSSSLIRGQTWAPCMGSTESEPLDHEESPYIHF